MIFQNFCIRMKILNHGNVKKPNRREIIFLRLNRFLTKCICQNFQKLKKKFFYRFYFLVGGKYNYIPGVFFFQPAQFIFQSQHILMTLTILWNLEKFCVTKTHFWCATYWFSLKKINTFWCYNSEIKQCEILLLHHFFRHVSTDDLFVKLFFFQFTVDWTLSYLIKIVIP